MTTAPRPAGPGNGPRLPAAYARFLERFAGGEYWDAHEALEPAWRETRSGFYKGLILLASAYVHAGRGNLHGVGAQLAKARKELALYVPSYMGLDVSGLLDVARRGEALANARRRSPPSAAEWAHLLPPPRLATHPARFRGDEPELAADGG